MKRSSFRHALVLLRLAIAAVLLAPATGSAATIFASSQLLVPGDKGIPHGQPGHGDSRENYLYANDTLAGAATQVSPVTTGFRLRLLGPWISVDTRPPSP